MVTSNRFRAPAMPARIATTVGILSGGRLDFGIGVGSRPDRPSAWREYAARGPSFRDSAHAMTSLGVHGPRRRTLGPGAARDRRARRSVEHAG
ncbi:hypothetical protein [Streptomyces shenzhenensis]|uniref:hypothetical protein n=1 Tax=Streptomyces shenzhenensis TaxID=943815 RepID=UPI003F541E6F